MHTPSPVHMPSTQCPLASHVRSCVPHMPQGTLIVAAGVHSTAWQGPSVVPHVAVHVRTRVWLVGHPSLTRVVVPGVHVPVSPTHDPIGVHVHVVSQKSVC